MFSILSRAAGAVALGAGLLKAVVHFSLKHIKYFIDSTFRDHVEPSPGSVIYCELLVLVEHSGIYVGDGNISNIVVDSLAMADSTVRISAPEDFTAKSKLGKKIYVSCDKNGAVGHALVAQVAYEKGKQKEKRFYGLVWWNCHSFSEECVRKAESRVDDESPLDFADSLNSLDISFTSLKSAARKNLGATTWRLWDWDAIHRT